MSRRRLQIKVSPGAKQDMVLPQQDGPWLVRVKAPAKEGKANEAVVAVLAAHLGVAKSQVVVEKGHASRLKTVSIPV